MKKTITAALSAAAILLGLAGCAQSPPSDPLGLCVDGHPVSIITIWNC